MVSCIAYGILTKDDVSEVIYMAADCNNDSVIDEADVDTSPEQDKAKVNILEMIINFIKSIF